MKVHVLVLAALVAGCGEDKCPDGLKPNGPDNCLVPGGEAGRTGETMRPVATAGRTGSWVEDDAGASGGAGGKSQTENSRGGAGRSNSHGAGGVAGRLDGSSAGASGSEPAGGGGSAGNAVVTAAGSGAAAPRPAGQVAPPPTPRCGDNNVDPGETCDGHCPESCDDGDPCTKDQLTGSDCNVRCVSTAIAAGAADGCCPDGATSLTDGDCSVSCGNGVVEAGETCDGDCPTVCGDGNACTSDRLTGSAARCTAACVSTAISSPANGDGCCPVGANATNDNDCKPICGNGVLESGEACDGNCPTSCPQDNDPCTVNEVVGTKCGATCKVRQLTRQPAGDCGDGKECTDDIQIESTSQCIMICKHEGKPKGTPCGGGGTCSGTLANSCDPPPPPPAAVCGDGKHTAPEHCDDGGETWECDRNCRIRNAYTRCAANGDCVDGQICHEGACTAECGLFDGESRECSGGLLPPSSSGQVVCLIPNRDIPRGFCRPRCDSDAQCPSGFRCGQPGDQMVRACVPASP